MVAQFIVIHTHASSSDGCAIEKQSDAEIQISSLSNGIADVGRPVENARSLAKIQGLEWNAITRPHTPIFRSG